jgi:phosphate-selective porin OprO and OprP
MKKKMLSKVALAALAAAGGTAATGAMSVAQAQTATINSPVSGAPEIREGQQRFRMRGRFQYDVYSNEWEAPGATVDTEDGSRSYVRRAFLGVQGRFTDHWRYKVDFVLNPGGNDATGNPATGGADDVAVDDAYLEYAGDFYSFVIGENNVTAPLEDRTSSLDIPFIERSSIINAYGYGRAAGAAFLITGANWMGAVGVYGDSLNNQDGSFASDEQTSISGRFTWAPIFETSPDGVTLLHLGVSARSRYNGDDALYRYRARPLNGRGSRWIESGSGAANATESDLSYGFEVAGQWNAFGFTAEYITLEGETTTGATVESDGYYVDATWSITGEPRPYRGNQGSFGPVIPRNSMLDGGLGHWSVIARYDFIDLSDLDVGSSRGEQESYAIGLNWVPVDHVRFMLNYAESDMDRVLNPVGSPDAEAQVISLRSQFDF